MNEKQLKWPFGKSREGEDPLLVDAPVRRWIPGLCKKCQYASDSCEGIEKRHDVLLARYIEDSLEMVVECEGFEGFELDDGN